MDIPDYKARIKKALERSAILVEKKVKELTPVDTGRARNSVTHRVKGNVAEVGTNLEYFPHIEYGTAPHEIRPKSKKALRFELGKKARLAARKGPGKGRIVFAKKVMHPGTPPFAPFRTGLFLSKKGIFSIFEDELGKK